MYAGRLKRYKNIHMIFDAMSILRKNNRNLRCVIAGSGDDEPRLRKHAKILGLADAVEFKGYITEAEKIDLYRRAVLFVNPSHKEGWGITCIESSACGTPIVANNVPGLRDSVKNGITGLLFEENNTESCAAAIEKLLDNTTMYTAMVAEGRQWAASFSWDTSALRMEDWIINTVCAKHS